MNSTIITTVLSLSGIGITSAVILYLIARRFKVFEDPRIDAVEEALPAANCGGCGYPGCRNFAEALVKSDDISSMYCPVGGNATMETVSAILGVEVQTQDEQVAVVRCSGSCDVRQRTSIYDGAGSCAVEAGLYSGDTGCSYGCLGHGDCVEACDFDAMYMDEETGLPVIIDDKCTACGACVTACPKDIIELRKKNKKDRKIFVSCVNEDKGGIAKKSCKVACIGCTKCQKVCPYDAITIENFLAYIDPVKCRLCRKCAPVCPTNCILEINYPPRKVRPEETSESGTGATAEEETGVREAPGSANDKTDQ